MSTKDCRIQNANFTTLPSNLLSAEEVSKRLEGLLSVERIKELASAGYMPCWIIDGQEPLYRVSDVKRYIGSELMQVREGASYPRVLAFPVAAAESPSSENLPEELFGFSDYLKWFSTTLLPPCVYFLCRNKVVVYVGQSINLGGRVAAHYNSKEFDTVFYIPVIKEHLSEVESAFIRSMRPHYNGHPPKMDCGDDTAVLSRFESAPENIVKSSS